MSLAKSPDLRAQFNGDIANIALDWERGLAFSVSSSSNKLIIINILTMQVHIHLDEKTLCKSSLSHFNMTGG